MVTPLLSFSVNATAPRPRSSQFAAINRAPFRIVVNRRQFVAGREVKPPEKLSACHRAGRRRVIRSPRRRGRAPAWEFRGQAPNVTLTVVGDLRSSNGELCPQYSATIAMKVRSLDRA